MLEKRSDTPDAAGSVNSGFGPATNSALTSIVGSARTLANGFASLNTNDSSRTGYGANGGGGSKWIPPSRPNAPTSALRWVTATAVAKPFGPVTAASPAIAIAGPYSAISRATRSICSAGTPVVTATVSGANVSNTRSRNASKPSVRSFTNALS